MAIQCGKTIQNNWVILRKKMLPNKQIEQNGCEWNLHKIVKLISIETGSRTPLSAAHWYTPAWWRSTRSNINVELSERCVAPEKMSCKIIKPKIHSQLESNHTFFEW